MAKSKIGVRNERTVVLPVMVEMAADLFKLKPNERLEMSFDPIDQPVDIEISDEGVRIYPNSALQPEFTIDGKEAALRSWSD